MANLESVATNIEISPSIKADERVLEDSEKIAIGSLLPVYAGSLMSIFDSTENIGYNLICLFSVVCYWAVRTHLKSHDRLKGQRYFESQ